MSRRSASRTTIALLVGVVIGALTTGVTYAVSSGSGIGVRACANSHGDLGLISNGRCSRGYKATTIAKQGPRGATGKTGAAGPSNGYSLSVVHPKADGTEVLRLPAGRYIVTWGYQDEEFVFNGPGASSYDGGASCGLTGTTGATNKTEGELLDDEGALVPKGNGSYAREGSASQTTAVTFKSAATVAIDCLPTYVVDASGSEPAGSAAPSSEYSYTDMSALAVGTLH